MSEKEVDVVGFDLDNTLYTLTEEMQSWIRQRVCVVTSERLRRDSGEVQREFEERYKELQSARRSLMALGLPEDESIDIVQRCLEEEEIVGFIKRDEQLAALIGKLRKEYGLFLITGSNEKLTGEKLRRLGVEKEVFSVMVCANTQYRREDGSAFHYVSAALQVPHQRMLFVGDREAVDILPAARLGIKTAIVNGRSAHATYNLSTLYDLEGILLARR